MPSVAQQFLDIAADEAAYLDNQRPALEAELLEIEARKREIEAQLHATKFAFKRSRNFVFKLGTYHYCPRCWVRHEDRTALRELPSDTKDDLFICDAVGCGLDVRIVMGV